MSRVRIVTDSTADIPQQERERLGIEMVPLKVHFGAETYFDAVTIHPEQFYEKLIAAAELPTTSQPSPVEFLEVYKGLLEQQDTAILSIHLSSAFSGTYQSAVLAKSLLEEQADITVYDSRTASYGLGMMVVLAAEAAKEGKSKQEILDMIERLGKETRLYFIVDTLEYLYKGGRIGKASAMLGSLLNIKPILTIDASGEVAPVDKVRGQKKAMQRIIELLERDFSGIPVQAVIAHSNAPDAADELSVLLRQRFEIKKLDYTTFGPVIGTHAGPGATAVFMIPAQP